MVCEVKLLKNNRKRQIYENERERGGIKRFRNNLGETFCASFDDIFHEQYIPI